MVALLLAWLIFVPLFMRHRAQARLEAYERELLASGEKLAISDLTPNPSAEGQKNAAALLRAGNSLTSTIDFYPNGMKEIKPGCARVAWRQTELNEQILPSGIFTNVWPLLRAARTNDDETFAEIRGILSAGNIQFPLDYQQEDFFSIVILNHFTMGKMLAVNAGAEVMLDLHDGRTNEAMENLLLCVEVPKFCADERLMISQMVGYAEVAIAVAPCWESLQVKGWTEEQLARLQNKWEALDLLSAAANSIAMERARIPMSFDQCRESKKEFEGSFGTFFGQPGTGDVWQDTLVDGKKGFGEFMQAATSYPRFWIWSGIWSYDDERLNMQLYQNMIDAIRAAQKRQGIEEQLKDAKTDDILSLVFASGEKNSKYPVTQNERPVVKKFVAQTFRVQTQVEMVTAAIALERYYARHHTYPEHLDALVPAFVKRVPVDYMDGKDLRYRLQPDGSYLLYSVGKNGVDDGGDPTPAGDSSWGFLRGRDWVWPRAATEQEVSASEAEEAQKMAQKQAKQRKPANQ
jgi:hypothetical protein